MSRYVPIRQAGAGGIGTVIACRDTNLDRQVAVKFVQHVGEHRRLLDELAALQLIRSMHVVEIFDVSYFDPGCRMGIVQEFIEGSDLSIHAGKLEPSNDFVRLVFQLASGLADIHAVGVVHRDIKPANVRVDHEGILKIIDFNLSRHDDDAQTQGFVGTRGFAAPELFIPGQVDFDRSIDMYALGVTAWTLLFGPKLPEALTRHPPQPDAWKLAGGGFPVPSGSMDPELISLLSACISDSPSSRPTAGMVAERAGRVLLQGQHRALFVNVEGRTYELDATNQTVRLKGTHGTLVVRYDGFEFRADSLSGEVWVNNANIAMGEILPNGCVIALGGPARRASDRVFVTMDVSHPEVVL